MSITGRLTSGAGVFALLSTVAGAAIGCASNSASGETNAAGNGPDGGGQVAEGADTRHHEPVACTWEKQPSNAACAGACPIALDEVLRCEDTQFAAPGVRVAPAPDATWLVTSSSNDRIVYRLANGAAEKQEGVPADFSRRTIALALAEDGTVHLGADTSAPSDEGGATYAHFANGAWTSQLVHDNPGKYTPLLDLEVGAGGPLAWIVSDPPSGYSLHRRKADGTWTKLEAEVPLSEDDGGGLHRFTLGRDGSIVALAFDFTRESSKRLRALVGGAVRNVGAAVSTIYDLIPAYSVTAPRAPTSSDGPLFAVAIAHRDGVHVVSEWETAPETEVTVPGTKAPEPTCETPVDTALCTGTCQETSSGMEKHAFALGWTADGVGWLAYVVTQLDQTITYGLQGDLPFCVGNVTSDRSTATLHVARVRLDGSAAEEVLSMPIDRPGARDAFDPDGFADSRFVDVRGFGKDLAIGVRTGWSTHAVRVLRIDTSKL